MRFALTWLYSPVATETASFTVSKLYQRQYHQLSRAYTAAASIPRSPRPPTNWHIGLLSFGTTLYNMNRKRTAPPAAVASTMGSTPKKRKVEKEQKYYAVQVGFRPGVYLTYNECSQQTTGFKGAVFKSFTSKDEAHLFAAGKLKTTPKEGPQRYYAVAVGNPTGIYTDWDDAAAAIKGMKGPKYKKFLDRAEAIEFIREFGSPAALAALGAEGKTTAARPAAKKVTAVPPPPADGVLRIYTDGSSLANGRASSRAGVGVFFGPGDPRNISERLVGEPQTNQRAELMAMLRALESAPRAQPVQIYSDSQYSINCVTQWAAGWKKKGWVTATGEEVKNQDIIRSVLDKMDERTRVGGITTYQWVKGHSTDAGNQAADRLAVAGAKMSL